MNENGIGSTAEEILNLILTDWKEGMAGEVTEQGLKLLVEEMTPVFTTASEMLACTKRCWVPGPTLVSAVTSAMDIVNVAEDGQLKKRVKLALTTIRAEHGISKEDSKYPRH